MVKDSVVLKVKTESGEELTYNGVEVIKEILSMGRVKLKWLGLRLVDTKILRDILGVEYLYTMRKRFLVPSFFKSYGKMPFLYVLCILLFSKKLRDYVIVLEIPKSMRKEFSRILYYCLVVNEAYKEGSRSEDDKGLLLARLIYFETGLDKRVNELFKKFLRMSGNSYEKLIKRFLKNHSLNSVEVVLKDGGDIDIGIIGQEYGEKHIDLDSMELEKADKRINGKGYGEKQRK